MTSPPLDSTHGRQLRDWHDIVAFGQHTRSDDVGRGMPSSPLGTHTVKRRLAWHAIIALGRQTPSTTSGVACHHCLWAAETVGRCLAWHVIIALERQTGSNDVRRNIPSQPLDSIYGRTTPGVACHHCPWTGNTVERSIVWNAINSLGQHK